MKANTKETRTDVVINEVGKLFEEFKTAGYELDEDLKQDCYLLALDKCKHLPDNVPVQFIISTVREYIIAIASRNVENDIVPLNDAKPYLQAKEYRTMNNRMLEAELNKMMADALSVEEMLTIQMYYGISPIQVPVGCIVNEDAVDAAVERVALRKLRNKFAKDLILFRI